MKAVFHSLRSLLKKTILQVGATDEGSFRDRTKRNFVCSEQSSYDESLRFVGSYEIRPVSSNRFEVSATLEILP